MSQENLIIQHRQNVPHVEINQLYYFQDGVVSDVDPQGLIVRPKHCIEKFYCQSVYWQEVHDRYEQEIHRKGNKALERAQRESMYGRHREAKRVIEQSDAELQELLAQKDHAEKRLKSTQNAVEGLLQDLERGQLDDDDVEYLNRIKRNQTIHIAFPLTLRQRIHNLRVGKPKAVQETQKRDQKAKKEADQSIKELADKLEGINSYE